MAAYTVNTGAAHEAAIDYLFLKENQRRTAAGQGIITRNQFVNGMFDRLLDQTVTQAKSTRMSERIQALNTANQSVLDQIDSTLGI